MHGHQKRFDILNVLHTIKDIDFQDFSRSPILQRSSRNYSSFIVSSHFYSIKSHRLIYKQKKKVVGIPEELFGACIVILIDGSQKVVIKHILSLHAYLDYSWHIFPFTWNSLQRGQNFNPHAISMIIRSTSTPCSRFISCHETTINKTDRKLAENANIELHPSFLIPLSS